MLEGRRDPDLRAGAGGAGPRATWRRAGCASPPMSPQSVAYGTRAVHRRGHAAGRGRLRGPAARARRRAQHRAAHGRLPRVIVDKSTVPVGTADKVRAGRGRGADARAASKFPSAWCPTPSSSRRARRSSDFMRPDRIVIGSDDERATQSMRELYAPVPAQPRAPAGDGHALGRADQVRRQRDARHAHLVHERAGATWPSGWAPTSSRCAQGIGSDPRIGYHFLYAGCGYGGSCFPKDVKALQRTGAAARHAAARSAARSRQVNERQKRVLLEKIRARFGERPGGPPLRAVGARLQAEHRRHARGAQPRGDRRPARARRAVVALRPGGDERRRGTALRGRRRGSRSRASPMAALEGADALVIVTEWKEFRSPDFDELRKRAARRRVIFDGRNLYEPGHGRARRPRVLRRSGGAGGTTGAHDRRARPADRAAPACWWWATSCSTATGSAK